MTQTKTSDFIWPSNIKSEVLRIYNHCISVNAATGSKELNMEKLLHSFFTVLFVRETEKNKHILTEMLKAAVNDNMIMVGELMGILEPFVEKCIDFGEFNLQTSSKIGLDSVVSQIHKFVIERGTDFNLMIVGRSGLGKSTLVDTIFRSQMSRAHHLINEVKDVDPVLKCSIKQIKHIKHVIEENKFRINLRIIDTPGFGDSMNNMNGWEAIQEYLKQKLIDHFHKEKEKERESIIMDERVHCCIYVISPTGHRLSPLDIEALKSISGLTNVIPVIGRSDSFTRHELKHFKKRIQHDLKENEINIYPDFRFSICQNEDENSYDNTIRDHVPFAVVGSNSLNNSKLGPSIFRITPYGTIDIMDPVNSDFQILLDILVKKRMISLIQTTDKVFYENYRKEKLM